MTRVRIKGNFHRFIEQFEEMEAAFAGQNGVRIRITNDVEYILHVEYGTSKMDARAMVRKSLPAIMDFIQALWAWLPMPFFPEDIELLMELAKDFAIEEIVGRTPRKTGRLAEGFQGVVMPY